MKIRILDRLLVMLAGLLLMAGAAALLAQAYFGVDIAAWVLAFIAKRDLKHMAAVIGVAVLLFVLGLYCFCMLFRHRKRKAGFVVQKSETGELSISIKALENLVQKCIDKHDDLHVVSTNLENTRDGLVIRLRAGLADGVNIPLAIGALQKQIRQYVTACSGVDVKEVRVQVVNTAAKVKESAYTVREGEMPAAAPAETVEVPAAVPSQPEEAPKKRPLHQRLFRHADEPAIVPAPPAPVAAEEAVTVETPAEEVPAAAENAPAETEDAAEVTVPMHLDDEETVVPVMEIPAVESVDAETQIEEAAEEEAADEDAEVKRDAD